MSDDSNNRSPKSLADVSHLFLSKTDDAPQPLDGAPDGAGDPPADEPSRSEELPLGPETQDVADRPASLAPALIGSGRTDSGAVRGAHMGDGAGPADTESSDGRSGSVAWDGTTLVVVTGGDRSPGKSTLALNLSHALMPRGRVALFDADPRLPNARFYAGLPSWNYLSSLTGDGKPAPVAMTKSGVIAVDCSGDSVRAPSVFGDGHAIYVDTPVMGRQPIDYGVVDLSLGRIDWIAPVADRVSMFVVVARPGRSGFDDAFGAMARLGRELGLGEAALVLNMAPDSGYAHRFHDKLRQASESLLSMDLAYLGGVAFEHNLGTLQRERGPIVISRPDAVMALMTREIASAIGQFEAARQLDSLGVPTGDGQRKEQQS